MAGRPPSFMSPARTNPHVAAQRPVTDPQAGRRLLELILRFSASTSVVGPGGGLAPALLELLFRQLTPPSVDASPHGPACGPFLKRARSMSRRASPGQDMQRGSPLERDERP
jgi:hypothetical protein